MLFPKTQGAFTPFESAFEEYGFSRTSVWWLRPGIDLERIRPGNPQEDGRHERMHLTLKQDTLRVPKNNILVQQEICV